MRKILNDKLIGKILKTFIEGFIASLVVTVPTIDDFTNKDLLKTILVGAIAMGISAVLNLLQKCLESKSNGKSNIRRR